MKGRRFIPVTIVLVILLALSAGLSTAQGPAPQGGGQTEEMVGSAFTYQGQLQKDGSPINATCAMTFTVYDDPTAGNLLAGVNANVEVSDGLFTHALDFGSGIFTGDARWLEVAVKCPGDAAASTLTPRQALTAAPYALSLRPGAIITGALEDEAALSAHNTATSGLSHGVYGQTDSASGYGVYGYNSSGNGVGGYSAASSGETYGVYGRSNSTGGTGVFGRAGAATGATYGVYGRSDSTAGTGVRGQATATSGTTYGVYGRSESPDGRGVAGYAGATSGDARGVYGRSESPDGAGVHGLSSATTGNGSGVYGESDSANGYGVTGYNYSGSGVYGLAETGIGVHAVSYSGLPIKAESHVCPGNLIEAWAYLFPPDLKFYVDCDGNVYADGTYSSPAADFAEMLPAVDGLEPGDVLVIGIDGQLARSSEAYQPTVVGVYSKQPGFLGGARDDEDMEGQIPLAIVGIVPVKVTAENGPIVPGDLLVTSSTPGYAMRAGENPPPGTVIGKAIDALESGSGVIQMLATLR